MFRNTGEKIITYAKIAFWVDAVAGFIGAIVIAEMYYDFMSFIMFNVSFIGFVAASYIKNLFLAGFGELINNSKNIRLTVCNEQDEENYNKEYYDEEYYNENNYSNNNNEYLNTNNSQNYSYDETKYHTNGYCPYCGRVLIVDGENNCTNCGHHIQ